MNREQPKSKGDGMVRRRFYPCEKLNKIPYNFYIDLVSEITDCFGSFSVYGF